MWRKRRHALEILLLYDVGERDEIVPSVQVEDVQSVEFRKEDAGEFGGLLGGPGNGDGLFAGEPEELAESPFNISSTHGCSFINDEQAVVSTAKQHMTQSVKLFDRPPEGRPIDRPKTRPITQSSNTAKISERSPIVFSFPVPHDRAGRRCNQCLQECGLAGAALADDADDCDCICHVT